MLMCYCRAVVVLCGIFLIAAAVIWPVMMLSLQRSTADNTPRWATHTKSCIRRFVIKEKAPTMGLLLVESRYYRFHI